MLAGGCGALDDRFCGPKACRLTGRNIPWVGAVKAAVALPVGDGGLWKPGSDGSAIISFVGSGCGFFGEQSAPRPPQSIRAADHRSSARGKVETTSPVVGAGGLQF